MFLRTLFIMLAIISLMASTSSPLLCANEPVPSIKPVYFDFDSSNLNQRAREQIRKVAEMMKNNPNLRVTIEGHTDERRSDEYALALGERLAKSAMHYLVSLGITPERINIISYGKSKPFDPRHNEKAWAKNRRVEFVFRKIEEN